EGRTILKTFAEFHRSWFGNNSFQFSLPQGECKLPNSNIYEATEPALHVTRAVLNPAAKYSDIVTLPNSLQSIRVNQNLTDGPVFHGIPAGGYAYDTSDATYDNLPWTPTLAQGGELLGIGPIRELKVPFLKSLQLPETSRAPAAIRSNVDVLKSQGGGLLGSNAYIILNAGREYTQILDGGKSLMRRWSKVVLQDVLCRDLPVIRLTDAKADPTSTISFRQGQTCMQCHSTMDPMAGVVRHLHLSLTGTKCTSSDTVHLFATPVSQPEETSVPDSDPLFSHRPRIGKIFFRSYNGDLIDIRVNGLQDLGTRLSQGRDLYACAAKRYYNFFTGINVSLQDAGDPQLPALSEDDLKHRNFVIQLADSLRNDSEQKVFKLLPKIFESAAFQSDNYLRGAQP
ncbi:MAG: hypothetical protein K2X47_17875, partial [Bdellovibrionales bacterium]|nr:hypothetical protein [Bdellovibrionales bacterium]